MKKNISSFDSLPLPPTLHDATHTTPHNDEQNAAHDGGATTTTTSEAYKRGGGHASTSEYEEYDAQHAQEVVQTREREKKIPSGKRREKSTLRVKAGQSLFTQHVLFIRS